MFIESFEVQLRDVLPPEVADQLQRFSTARVEGVKVRDDFSAIERSFCAGELHPEGFAAVWEGLKGGEEILDEFIVET